MEWDWKGEYREHLLMREKLKREPSEKNFKKMIEQCHDTIYYYWHAAIDMEKYKDVVQTYETTAVAFWKKYKTTESLYHVVYFYGDFNFVMRIYRMDAEPDQLLEHMKKGILYAQLYHEKVNKDYSAALLIRLYRSIYEIRQAEGLVYLKQACSVAKEWTHRLKTPFLMNEYAWVSYEAQMDADRVRWKDKKKKQEAEQVAEA
ncbi:MAG: hypothetical protein NC548_28875, partial [Lachnospiraceae bacterium]|nr:hypothetical protein [Lachnospiraceae bacterium]